MIIKTIFLILAWIAYGFAAWAGITKWIIPATVTWTKYTYSGMLAGLLAGLIWATIAHFK
jgi:hypothetical protein